MPANGLQNMVIVGYVRSPFHPAKKGDLARVRPDDLAAETIRQLIEKTKVKPEEIEDLIIGCAFPEAEQGLNLGRMVGLLADLPLNVAGMTVNRFCGSSMQSVHIAAGAIAAGMGEVFICAGVESMSRVPMMGYNPLPNPKLASQSPDAYISMGITAENVARKWQITRAEQEDFAVASHAKAALAESEGRFTAEIVQILNNGHAVGKDGCIRKETTRETLAALKPAFDQEGTITAGTSSPLTDGAAAVLLCTESYAEKNGLTPLARLKSFAVAGCAPGIMGIGPVEATKKALVRAGISIDEIDIVELNEAFASQALACIRELGLSQSKINIDGGAIALGHPLGATGARIVGKTAALLEREKAKYGLATQCIGGGQGIATILERI